MGSFAFALVLALAGPNPAPAQPSAPAATSCAGLAPDAERPAHEDDLVHLVNRRRRASGLPPFKQVEPLTGAARWYARDMARDDYFPGDHQTYDRARGRLVAQCAFRARLGFYYKGWSSIGENIAAGHESAREVIEDWLRSPGHRARMLDRNFWETGAGYASGGSEGTYWVQDFGRRRGAFPLVIDDEAPRAFGRGVRLYVYGRWVEMRLRNDELAFTPWQRFASEFDWQLAEGEGARRVTVELRSGQQRATASDTIQQVTRP